MTRQGVTGKEKRHRPKVQKTFWRLLSLAAAMSWVAGCGRRPRHSQTRLPWFSITVTPTNASIQASATQQFTATGVFSDSSNRGHDQVRELDIFGCQPGATIQNSGLATTDHSSETVSVQVRLFGEVVDPSSDSPNPVAWERASILQPAI